MKLDELLTEEQVEKEAKASAKRALAVSVKHWEQAVAMTPEDLCKASAWDGGFDVSDLLCGLCQRYFDSQERITSAGTGCSKCPLARAGSICITPIDSREECASVWWKASIAYDDLFHSGLPCPKKKWSAWQRAAKAMLKKLKALKEPRK